MQATPEPEKTQACSTPPQAHPKAHLPYIAPHPTMLTILHLSMELPGIIYSTEIVLTSPAAAKPMHASSHVVKIAPENAMGGRLHTSIHCHCVKALSVASCCTLAYTKSVQDIICVRAGQLSCLLAICCKH